MFTTLSDFYRSNEWQEFRKVIIAERIQADGFVYCEHCGKPIVKAYDIILHHRIELTLENVNDANITFANENIQLVHFRCHNDIHNRFGKYTRHIYLVYGSPFAGKTTYVEERAGLHDLVVDLDKIRTCITNNPMYIRSGRIDDNVFAVRDCLYEQIKTRRGKWVNAFIVGTFAYKGERERLCNELGAEPIYIPCTQDEALSRLQVCEDRRDKKEWEKYIHSFFNRYQE